MARLLQESGTKLTADFVVGGSMRVGTGPDKQIIKVIGGNDALPKKNMSAKFMEQGKRIDIHEYVRNKVPVLLHLRLAREPVFLEEPTRIESQQRSHRLVQLNLRSKVMVPSWTNNAIEET